MDGHDHARIVGLTHLNFTQNVCVKKGVAMTERRMNAKDLQIDTVQQEALGLTMRGIIRAEVTRQLTTHKEQDHEGIHRQQISEA